MPSLGLTLVCVLCAAASAATPADQVKALFDAMRGNDRKALAAIYSDRAWKLLHPTGGDEGEGDVAKMMHDRMASVSAVDVDSIKHDNNTATVAITINQIPKPEHATIFLRKLGDTWRIDYPDDNIEAPFCLAELGCMYLVWKPGYEDAKELKDPTLYYQTVLTAALRAEAFADARPENIAFAHVVGQLYWERLGTGPFADFTIDAVRKDHPAASAARYAYLEGRNFSDGIPPQAIAYDYFKHAQHLLKEGHHNEQMADVVIDSRPMLALKSWAEEEARRANKLEAAPAERDRAIALYESAAKLFYDAFAELADHINRFPQQKSTFSVHEKELQAFGDLYAADAAFLRARGARSPAATTLYTSSQVRLKEILKLFDDPEDKAEYQVYLDHVEARLRELKATP